MASQIETALRHEISVNRVAAQIIATQINPAFINISEIVRRLLIEEYSPDMTARQMDSLRRKTEKQLRKALDAMWAEATKDLKSLAEYEAEYTAKTIADFAKAEIAAATLTQIAARYELPMILTSGDAKTVGLWPEYVAGNIDATINLVDSEIRAGRAEALGNQQIVSRIVGLKKNNYSDGLLVGKSRKWAENLVITGNSHYANAARDAAMQANSDIIEGKVFCNVFDNRTTKQCLHYGQEAYNGKVYKLDDPKAPRLPLHFRERSLWITKLYGVDPFDGRRAAIQGKKGDEAAQEFEEKQSRTDKKVKYKGRKDSDIFNAGSIDGKISPQEFYENQPDWYLQSTFGKTGAKLFKEGGLPIEKFTDTMGRPLTIAQMKELDEYDKYFRNAGL